jgi:hypothetical protein
MKDTIMNNHPSFFHKQFVFQSLLLAVILLSTLMASAQPVSTTDKYKAPYTSITPDIDGIANESSWNDASWVSINNLYLGQAVTASDFTGRFKMLWSSSKIYLLVEVTDDILSDDYADPLSHWWDDDCVEIFLDENKSGGDHQYNYNAFAYHVGLDYNAVDIGTDHNPHLYNDHITTVKKVNGSLCTWEFAINVYPDTYVYGGTAVNPVTLTKGKLLGFNLAYCDNDAGTTRESFIGSKNLAAADRDRGYIDASVFGGLELVASSSKLITAYSFNLTGSIGIVSGNNISVTVPNGTNTTNLVASFTNSSLSNVKIGSTDQVSGSTQNNFTTPVTYTVTAEDGTTNNYIVTVTVEPTGSVDEIENQLFKIYPNPVSPSAPIFIESIYGFYRVIISDFSGIKLKTINYSDTNSYRKNEIDLNGLNKGVYFFTIYFKDQVSTRKVIIQ